MCYCFFSSIRRHTRCALVTGVQTCALPISTSGENDLVREALLVELERVVEAVLEHPGGAPVVLRRAEDDDGVGGAGTVVVLGPVHLHAGDAHVDDRQRSAHTHGPSPAARPLAARRKSVP